MADRTSEDVIRNIIRDIVARSTAQIKSRRLVSTNTETSHGWQVTETLAAFILRSVVLDPSNGFNIEAEMGKEDVERLIKTCVDKIVTNEDIQMENIKMQIHFDTNFGSQDEFLHREKLSHHNAVLSILREITEAKAKSLPAYEALYRKIVSYVMLKSKLGNPTDIKVVRETTAALESVFPQSELSAFTALPRQDKETQLNGLVQLVMGIRLFNMQLGKGGFSIENLPEICSVDLEELLSMLKDLVTTGEKKSQDFTTIIKLFQDSHKTNNTEILQTLTSETSTSPVSLITKSRQALAFYQQLLLFSDAIYRQLLGSRNKLAELNDKFQATVTELKTICRLKSAVPVDQVYPNFIIIAHLWQTYQDELFLLAFRRGMTESLTNHSTNFHITIPEEIQQSASQYTSSEPTNQIKLSDADRITNATELMKLVAATNKAVEVLHPGNITNYDLINLEMNGFCIASLVDENGSVVQGSKNFGVMRYKDKMFAFSSLEKAGNFIKSPDRYISTTIEAAKHFPELIHLFQLQAYFPTIDALERAKSYARTKVQNGLPLVSEAGIQTDTHIVDTYIDPNYQWNEWELRRKALLLVNLRKKQTHSTQTALSHFKRESETQCYLPKTQTTQTLQDGKTQVPRKQTFLKGLRHDGKRTDVKFKVVDLTLDI